MKVADRCRSVAGDLFQEVSPADASVLKHILHDWNDGECVQILSNLRRAAREPASVFAAEYVVPALETPHFAKLFDIHMMVWGTGRERTEEEYASLLQQAGWKFVQTWHPSSRAMGVVEGVSGSGVKPSVAGGIPFRKDPQGAQGVFQQLHVGLLDGHQLFQAGIFL